MSSLPVASLVALAVALGAAVLLENVVPAGVGLSLALFGSGGGGPRFDLGFLWVGLTVIRLLSFAMGGWAAARLRGAGDRRLSLSLLVVAVLATVFQPFPFKVPVPIGLVLWSLSAPVGVALGAWACGRTGKAAV